MEMGKYMSKVQKNKKTVVNEYFSIKLSGKEIIELLNQSGEYHTDEIPSDANVTFTVPGGADWSHMSLEVDEYPIEVSWEEETTHRE